jgi:hypothetical protein
LAAESSAWARHIPEKHKTATKSSHGLRMRKFPFWIGLRVNRGAAIADCGFPEQQWADYVTVFEQGQE